MEGLDIFYGIFQSNEKKFDILWSVFKMIMILSDGQSSLEGAFSFNEESLPDNLKEKALVSERLI